jgi:hypothetical protein
LVHFWTRIAWTTLWKKLNEQNIQPPNS